MIKIILGKKGTGKTKAVIDLANSAAASSGGHVVVIEKGNNLRFDINHNARLISAEEYEINTCDKFIGFIAGIAAANYDVTDILVDSVYKIISSTEPSDIDNLLEHMEKLGNMANINFVITVSEDPANMSEYVKSYC
ncbi:hypothetical protein SDC9_112646 [bioreactor metagenome]|uniref:Twitching motility protein PilT n=1 Tax=bioreactor metagenome TaxID=1076179 RepID=A0A645BK55_9ZZZZ